MCVTFGIVLDFVKKRKLKAKAKEKNTQKNKEKKNSKADERTITG